MAYFLLNLLSQPCKHVYHITLDHLVSTQQAADVCSNIIPYTHTPSHKPPHRHRPLPPRTNLPSPSPLCCSFRYLTTRSQTFLPALTHPGRYIGLVHGRLVPRRGTSPWRRQQRQQSFGFLATKEDVCVSPACAHSFVPAYLCLLTCNRVISSSFANIT